MLRPFRFHIILIFVLFIGALVLQSLLSAHTKSIEAEYQDRLLKVHSDAMLRANAGIDVYAALVSSLRSHVKYSTVLPEEIELQNFLKDLIKDLNFNDSIVVNFLDTNHEFKYVFSPTQINVANLKGEDASEFRPKEEINKLNELMQTDKISLFEPINLHEGWAGFPFNFAAKDNNNKVLGYFAPIINVKYLLNYFYTSQDEEFVHHFNINDNFDISREAIYDGTPIFNSKRDPQYYKNFNIEPENFVNSSLDVFGIKLNVGSAYKKQPIVKSNLTILAYLWYGGLIGLSLLTLIQFFRNNKLNEKLKLANLNVEEKNSQLEKSINHIRTLIKEIHHRIKNNMMMITGLLDLQSEEYEDPKIIKALEKSKSRIQSMSLIHEKLYGSETLEDINAIEYIRQLIGFIEQTVKNSDIEIRKDLDISSNLNFDGETMVPLGLILNELITNSYKYAFNSNKENILKIEIKNTENGYLLTYSDNGPGIPDSLDINNTKSLGMQLIILLSEELHGEMTYKKDDYSTFKVNFKKKYN